MKLKFAVASMLTIASMGAFAADQNLVLDANGTQSFIGTGSLLDGGSDVLTFTGVPAGLYEVLVTFSGQYLKFDSAGTTLNGSNLGVWTQTQDLGEGKFKQTVSFGYVNSTTAAPFALNLAGVVTNAAKANYSGEISVSAVPEPTTYGMLLGGLGIMGFLARRKSKQA
ncbi:FxDxF family PEP-CTERM protein [Pseudoduganella umbonata]|uniref:PEP-CTERM sorting domain-containing protein n=1 Tax=Pseudoduganella umbonata TaxID=864828 RepID=A0A4P8HY73_9BURK|nr:FxDxF family PEP-CTERM protein [Pseudoduganella umbonata]MBB3223168.1 hypothetical protein [Pseudoduganella umbonata]QCP13898.1 PEP-CTERM sorting domain-containing protein [Pseudoduganella umbonata]